MQNPFTQKFWITLKLGFNQNEQECPLFEKRQHSWNDFLYADERESRNIRQQFPQFVEEGPAFYAYGADAGRGEDVYRFQNSQQQGTFIFVNESERQTILADFPQFIDEGVAFEALI